MARSLTAEVLTALQNQTLVARDFLWIVARDRSSGESVSDGMWSDIGNISAEVIDPDAGNAETRAFFGSGTLIKIGDIPLVSNITVQRVTVTMSQVEDRVASLVRFYDVRQARIEIFRGLFDPATRALVSPAVPRFVGFVDQVEIKTGSENEEGAVVLSCVSHTQELLRSNPDTRSHESQKQRSATDNFFVDASVVGEWDLQWGESVGPVVQAAPQNPPGLFGWNNFLGFL